MTCFLTCTAGLPTGPEITPSYSCETDALDVILTSPFDLQSVDSIVVTYDLGDNTYPSPFGYTEISPTHYRIFDASTTIIPPATVTAIKFYVGVDLVGTWTGALSIDCGPIIESVVVTP